jgi:hypothetical protein
VVCLALLLGGTLGAGFVGSVDAAPPPRPVCAACGDAVEERAAEYGVDLAVTNSTARVTVAENGSAAWLVRNELGERASVDRLRENATLRGELADAHYWDVEVVSTSVTDDGVFTARYRDPDFAREGAGDTLLSGVFTHEYGYRNLEGLGADRLVVVAPDGMQIAQTVPGATRTDDRTRMVLTTYDRGGFVTFVPEGATGGVLWGWLAIAMLVGPVVVRNAAIGILVPAGVVGAVVGLGGRALGRLEDMVSEFVDAPGRALSVVGAGGIAFSLLAGAGGRAGVEGVMLFGVSVVAVTAGFVWSRAGTARVTFWRVAVLALVGAGMATVATLAGSVLFSGRVYWFGLASRLPTLLALFALVPAGYAVRRGARRRGVLTAVTGVIVALALTVPLTARLWPFTLAQRLVFAVVSALALVAVGLPFLIVGSALARVPAGRVSDGSL